MENETKRKRGPAPRYGEKIIHYSISITPTQASQLRLLGDGNMSEGVRRALAISKAPTPEP